MPRSLNLALSGEEFVAFMALGEATHPWEGGHGVSPFLMAHTPPVLLPPAADARQASLAHSRAARGGWYIRRHAMPFAYYSRLSARGQAIYRSSDRVSEIALPNPESLRRVVEDLRRALEDDDRKAVELTARGLGTGLTEMLKVRPVGVEVLAVRPSSPGGELHGLYTPNPRRPPTIKLWMRTARHQRVVAFRTFLRTLLHELGHHLDYEYLRLEDSFHTEGFFRRESSLFAQLAPPRAPGPASRASRRPGETR